jgi:GTP-binding protein SAR1
LQAIERLKFRAWDLGGHEAVRNLWQEYFVEVDAIIFVVDTADVERLDEAKEELGMLLGDNALEGVPFLILGNKSDLPGCISREQLIDSLELRKYQGKERDMEVFSCSLVEQIGYQDGLKWLADVL